MKHALQHDTMPCIVQSIIPAKAVSGSIKGLGKMRFRPDRDSFEGLAALGKRGSLFKRLGKPGYKCLTSTAAFRRYYVHPFDNILHTYMNS